MNLPTEIFGDVIVVHTPQELGCEQMGEFESFIGGLEPRKVVLNLDATELLDSRGLEGLLTAQEHLRQSGGDVKITTANVVNRKILEITRLDQRLEVFEDVIDAVKSFQ